MNRSTPSVLLLHHLAQSVPRDGKAQYWHVTETANIRSTSFELSEIFESIQGEGPSAGERCIFVRLATCNLRCSWCDTRYTWDWHAYRYEDEVTTVAVAEVAARVGRAAARRLVVTGGEPLLQQPALQMLLSNLPTSLVVEVETNGTILPAPALVARIDQWNVSPKLANSGEPERRRLRSSALETLRDTGRAYLKLVVESEGDLAEADALVRGLAWPHERVLLMPQASRRDELRERSGWVRRAAEARGFRASPRLHIERWDGRRGV